MIRGLQVGFGASIAHELPALRDLGVQLVRLDCMGLSAEATRDLVGEPLTAGLVPFPIVDTLSQLKLLPAGTNVELRNEPDLNGPSPAVYSQMVATFAEVCERRGLYLWAGCVSNLNQRGLGYLSTARPDRWPANVHISVHRYPHGDTPWTPHPGYSSRVHEVDTLRMIIGARRWGVSEFGYHTANRATRWERIFGIKRQWTDTQVAEYVRWEFDFLADEGAAGACLYQLNDGLSPAAVDHYGIRRTDGTWKPSAFTFQETTR